MSLVKVWNDNEKTYQENFRGDLITIPGKASIPMDYYDAVQFLGQYIKPIKIGDGTFTNHKQLRIEGTPPAFQATKPRCQMCKGEFATETELTLHSDQFHRESIIIDDKVKQAVRK